MKLDKDEEYYLLAKFTEGFELYKLQVTIPYEGKHGLGVVFRVLWHMDEHRTVKHEDGKTMSGNQFPQANTTKNGLADLLYKTGDRNLIKGILR